MKAPRTLLLTLVFATSVARAASFSDFLGLIGGALANGSSSSGTTSAQSLALSMGLQFAKSDPSFAAIFAALGINNSTDLEAYLKGDLSGANFRDIVVHAAFEYAKANPKHAQWLAKVGVKDEPSLRAFLKGKGGKTYQDYIYTLALEYARANPTYATWLEELDIEGIEDIRDILSGGLEGTNLKDFVMSLGMRYLQSNPNYTQYAFILSLIMGDDFVSLPVVPYLGAFEGLPLDEIKNIHRMKKLKARPF